MKNKAIPNLHHVQQTILFLVSVCASLVLQAQTKVGSSVSTSASSAPSTAPQEAKISLESLKFEEVFKVDDVIWGFEWVDDNTMIINLKGGKILQYNLATKKQVEIAHDIKIADSGQGGLLDVAKDTKFDESRLLFFTYAKRDAKKDVMTTELAQAKLEGNRLVDLRVLATANAWTDNKIHFGSRIVVTDEEIFFTVGDRNERDLAQDKNVDNGKVLRVNRKTLAKDVFSYGHRNPQGLARHPVSGDLWMTEHGPRGGDEINHIQFGKNYGWPVVTYGREYWGPKISDLTSKPGIEDPVHQMTPSIAPSSLMIYSGKKYPQLKDVFMVGALVKRKLSVFQIEDKKLKNSQDWLVDLKERIRNVKESPQGDIFFATDSGKIFRSL